MKQFATLLVMTLGSAFAQNCLVNTYSSYSEVHGGTEDSGIQRTESYIFVAHCPLKVLTVHYLGDVLLMKKGDSLQVSVHQTTAYDESNATVEPSVSLNATAQLEV